MQLSNPYAKFALGLALSISSHLTSLCAQQHSVPQSEPHVTLAIFSGDPRHPVPAQLWLPLESDLQSGLAAKDPELQPLAQDGAQVQILRADQVTPGIVVTDSITVYLHGVCSLHPYRITAAPHRVSGALGWVERRRGQIEPFLHIDCDRLAQLLQPQSAGRDATQRNEILARAIARVLLHEWLHVATQNPHHAEEGIAKAQFNIADLLAAPSSRNVRSPELSPVLSPSSGASHGK
jgi:hypothetical protein